MNLLYDERFSPAEIAHRVQSIGQRLSSDFPDTPIVLIAILKGAALFASDLARTLPRSVRLEYIDVIRGGEEEIVDFHFVTPFNVRGADIIILKDVIRSGIIESYLADQLREEGPTVDPLRRHRRPTPGAEEFLSSSTTSCSRPRTASSSGTEWSSPAKGATSRSSRK